MVGAIFFVGLLVFWLATILLIRGVGQTRALWFWMLWPFFPVNDIREQWFRLAPWAFLRAIGLAAIVFAGTLYLAQLQVVQNYLAAGSLEKEEGIDASGSLLASEMAMWRDLRKRKNERLAGVFRDEQFIPLRVEIINNVLSIRTEGDLLPDREIRLVFAKPLATTKPLKMVVEATDLDGPQIQLSWRDPDNATFQTQIFDQGYRLDLAWYPLDKNQLAAQLELVLPGDEMSYLVGDTFIHTNNLRFKYGLVDTSFDHEDTLVYLLDQRINERYPARLVVDTELVDAKISVLKKSGSVRKQVTLENGRVELWKLDFRRFDEGWVPLAGSLEISKIADEAPLGRVETVVLKAKDKLLGKDVEFIELANFVGQTITVDSRDSGSLRQGTLKFLNERGLMLVQSIGAGSVEVFFPKENVLAIEISSGELIRIAQAPEGELMTTERESPLRSVVQAALPPRGRQQLTETEQEEEVKQPYAEFLHQWVEVVDVKGRKRVGELTDVGHNLTIKVSMGSGSTAYHYKLEDIESIRQASRP